MSDPNCIFCKIATGEIDADVVHETDELVAFSDLNPQAPMHILIIPRHHVATINDLTESDTEVIGQLFIAAKAIAAREGYTDYRVVMNCNADAGQSVFHVHLHLLGGRQFGWPPG